MVKVRNVVVSMMVLMFVFVSCYSLKKVETYEINGIKVYQSLGGFSNKVRSNFEKRGINRVFSINIRYIDKGHNFTISKDKLRERLDLIMPNRLAEEIIVLDVEGYMKDLRYSKDKELVDKIMNHYIAIYDFAKSLRPKSKIGFYGFPYRDYWHREDGWKESNEALMPLMKKVDVLFPSIYDFYEDGVEVSTERDMSYVKDNVEEALRIAELAGGKEVYPFIWHRYHNANKKVGMQFIDETEFYNHVKEAAKSKYNGQKITGIIWWSSERYFYNVSERGKINKRNSDADFDKYSNATTFDYISILEKAIREGSQAGN
ncbi:hyaluronidase [Saprospiraceae bacterium]|nr:hyaluronidase [Saprospiraceae bacterium]